MKIILELNSSVISYTVSDVLMKIYNVSGVHTNERIYSWMGGQVDR